MRAFYKDSRNTLVGESAGQYELVYNVPVPDLGPDQVVCKVGIFALNPTDWKMIGFSVVPGAVGGHDFAGEVVEVGAAVTRLKKGHRVFGLAISFDVDDKRTGAFTDYMYAIMDHLCPQRLEDT